MTFPYDFGNTGKTLVLSEFFTYTAIDGCTLTCNYGDTCGADQTAAPLTAGTFTVPTTLTYDSGDGGSQPFDTLSAINNVIPGYNLPICMYCAVNNAVSSPFTKSLSIIQT